MAKVKDLLELKDKLGENAYLNLMADVYVMFHRDDIINNQNIGYFDSFVFWVLNLVDDDLKEEILKDEVINNIYTTVKNKRMQTKENKEYGKN